MKVQKDSSSATSATSRPRQGGFPATPDTHVIHYFYMWVYYIGYVRKMRCAWPLTFTMQYNAHCVNATNKTSIGVAMLIIHICVQSITHIKG